MLPDREIQSLHLTQHNIWSLERLVQHATCNTVALSCNCDIPSSLQGQWLLPLLMHPNVGTPEPNNSNATGVPQFKNAMPKRRAALQFSKIRCQTKDCSWRNVVHPALKETQRICASYPPTNFTCMWRSAEGTTCLMPCIPWTETHWGRLLPDCQRTPKPSLVGSPASRP